MGFVIACFVFLVCAFYWLFFPSSVAHICLSALSVFEPVSHHVHVYVGGNGSPSPISFERVRALCRSMGSVGGGSRLGRGWDSRFPCFWCSMPQRVSVSLIGQGSMLSSDSQSRSSLYFCRPQLTLCLPSRLFRIPPSIM
ncbi:hypothetical protein DFH94DRAFT_11592 [Russula ochroleuca]|uniref:Uncharacterized protein n=1 Tax=Russula ochroleuca TaxID=152965 RepID=A0A9P5N5X8_9AGAM|nr:hypothetical protein DFH94DRAFT_11592 [Russula ochroleuca]